jgi:pyruvate formate lyase activating enzyme
MRRRDFLSGLLGIAVPPILAGERDNESLFRRPAKHWRRLEEKRVECTLCPRACTVADRERGYCGVRENIGGEYHTLVYGRAVAAHVDPIEKKPLFHFLPGTTAFSIATAGCNMECKFCQNWDISQFRPEQVRAMQLYPEDVAAAAARSGSSSIAYTYSEPVVFYEYMLDSAIAGHRHGVRSVMISNGYMLQDPFLELLPHLDAVKVDLKAFTDEFYRNLCSGRLEPVLDGLRWIHQQGTWLEIVVLILPSQNDDPGEIRAMSRWIVRNLPRTPTSTLQRCHEIACEEGINYVYLGNVPGLGYEDTFCPECGTRVVRRIGYTVLENIVTDGACPSCRRQIPGIWS